MGVLSLSICCAGGVGVVGGRGLRGMGIGGKGVRRGGGEGGGAGVGMMVGGGGGHCCCFWGGVGGIEGDGC